MGERETFGGGLLLAVIAVGMTVFLMWNHGRPDNMEHLEDCHEWVHLVSDAFIVGEGTLVETYDFNAEAGLGPNSYEDVLRACLKPEYREPEDFAPRERG